MHNQDTTKDDFLETLMAVFEELKKYYQERFMSKSEDDKALEEEVHNEKDVSKNNDEKKTNFQEAMQSIIDNTEDPKMREVAQTLYDNPEESMKMLSAVNSQRAKAISNELISLTKGTNEMIEQVKSNVDMEHPNALDHIQTLNSLQNNEQKKVILAESIIKDFDYNIEDSKILEGKRSENRLEESENDKDKSTEDIVNKQKDIKENDELER